MTNTDETIPSPLEERVCHHSLPPIAGGTILTPLIIAKRVCIV